MTRGWPAVLALAAALIAAGCGGDDDGGDAPQASSPSGRETTKPPRASTDDQGRREKDGGEKPKDDESRSEDPLARAPRKVRTETITRVSEGIAGLNGLRPVRVGVSADGHSVTVGVAANVACAAPTDAGTRTAAAIKDQLAIVRDVAITVGGRSFATHRSSCRAPRLPGGSGPVVYAKSGLGNVTTPGFKITSKRWTIAYRGDGLFLVFLVKNGKTQQEYVKSSGRSAGSKTFTGPGTFSLKISGAKPWAVTVRDGA